MGKEAEETEKQRGMGDEHVFWCHGGVHLLIFNVQINSFFSLRQCVSEQFVQFP